MPSWSQSAGRQASRSARTTAFFTLVGVAVASSATEKPPVPLASSSSLSRASGAAVNGMIGESSTRLSMATSIARSFAFSSFAFHT